MGAGPFLRPLARSSWLLALVSTLFDKQRTARFSTIISPHNTPLLSVFVIYLAGMGLSNL